MVGPLFRETGRTAVVWQKVHGSEVVPVFGQSPEVEAAIAPVDARRMIESFRIGYKNLREVWGIVLPPSTLIELRKLHVVADDGFRFSDEVWARTVYDFALGYHYRRMNQDHLLGALTPLYLGWVASFVLEMKRRQLEAEGGAARPALRHLRGAKAVFDQPLALAGSVLAVVAAGGGCHRRHSCGIKSATPYASRPGTS